MSMTRPSSSPTDQDALGSGWPTASSSESSVQEKHTGWGSPQPEEVVEEGAPVVGLVASSKLVASPPNSNEPEPGEIAASNGAEDASWQSTSPNVQPIAETTQITIEIGVAKDHTVQVTAEQIQPTSVSNTSSNATSNWLVSPSHKANSNPTTNGTQCTSNEMERLPKTNASSSGWDAPSPEKPSSTGWARKDNNAPSSVAKSNNGWGTEAAAKASSTEDDTLHSGDTLKEPKSNDKSNTVADELSNDDKTSTASAVPKSNSGWGTTSTNKPVATGWGSNDDDSKSNSSSTSGWGASSTAKPTTTGWGSKDDDFASKSSSNGWTTNTNKSAENTASDNKTSSRTNDGWGAESSNKPAATGWGAVSTDKPAVTGWGSDDTKSNNGWGSDSATSHSNPKPVNSPLVNIKNSFEANDVASSPAEPATICIDEPSASPEVQDGWDVDNTEPTNAVDLNQPSTVSSNSGWSTSNETSTVKHTGWGSPQKAAPGTGWGPSPTKDSTKDTPIQATSASGWGSPKKNLNDLPHSDENNDVNIDGTAMEPTTATDNGSPKLSTNSPSGSPRASRAESPARSSPKKRSGWSLSPLREPAPRSQSGNKPSSPKSSTGSWGDNNGNKRQSRSPSRGTSGWGGNDNAGRGGRGRSRSSSNNNWGGGRGRGRGFDDRDGGGRGGRGRGGRGWGNSDRDGGGRGWGNNDRDGGSRGGRGFDDRDGGGRGWGNNDRDGGGRGWGNNDRDRGGRGGRGFDDRDGGGRGWGSNDRDGGGRGWGNNDRDGGSHGWGNNDRDGGRGWGNDDRGGRGGRGFDDRDGGRGGWGNNDRDDGRGGGGRGGWGNNDRDGGGRGGRGYWNHCDRRSRSPPRGGRGFDERNMRNWDSPRNFDGPPRSPPRNYNGGNNWGQDNGPRWDGNNRGRSPPRRSMSRSRSNGGMDPNKRPRYDHPGGGSPNFDFGGPEPYQPRPAPLPEINGPPSPPPGMYESSSTPRPKPTTSAVSASEWFFTLNMGKKVVQCRAMATGLPFKRQPIPQEVNVTQLPKLANFKTFMHLENKLECPHWIYEMLPLSAGDAVAYEDYKNYLLRGRQLPVAGMSLDIRGYKIIILPPGPESRLLGYIGVNMIAVIRKNQK